MLSETFDAESVAVCTGGVDVGKAFSELPFDHLLFTGSTQLGKAIIGAAAKNLTPITLGLGGKSLTLAHPDFPVDRFAKRIIHTKIMNSG